MPEGLAVERRTLEDVFLALTGRDAAVSAAVGPLAPRPGPAPLPRMVSAHAGFELGQLLRNGEQLLLTVVIPTVLLLLFSKVDVVDLGPGSRIDFLLPGILALAVLSTAFTAQAIGTGFERRYGVLKRLGATPLPRAGLLAGKTGAVLAVEVGPGAAAGGGRRGARLAAARSRTSSRRPCSSSWARWRSPGWRCSWPARCGPRPRWPPPTSSTSCCCWAAGSSSR